MTRTESIASATRRFVEAQRKHAAAQAKADQIDEALQRVGAAQSKFAIQRYGA